MALFTDKTKELIEHSFREAQYEHRQSVAEPLDRALDYARNKMVRDVENQLSLQYENRQISDEPIITATVPLVSFFVKEQARLYKGQVQRKLVHRETDTDAPKDLQKQYEEFLEESDYSAAMTELLTRLVLFEETAVLPSVQNGEMDIRIVKAHDVWGLRPPMSADNPAKASAYDKHGYVIDSGIRLDNSHAQSRIFSLIKPQGMVIYEGTPDRINGEVLQTIENPITWPTVQLDKKGRPTKTVKNEQLQMLLPLHSYYATDTLFNLHEPPIYTANRILNVQFSVLHDVFRWQAAPIPIIKLMDKDAGVGQRVIGVNRPLVLQAEAEEAEFANSMVDFEMLARYLMLYARITGLLLRLAPDDLAVEAQAPQSGFAKVIENLPKQRAVEDLLPWVVRAEKAMFSRVAGIGVWLSKLPKDIEAYKLEVEFDPPEIPKSADERSKEEMHDLKLGITTAGQILADLSGLSVEQAEAKIEENQKKNEKTLEALNPMKQQPGGPQQQGSNFNQRVNQRSRGRLAGGNSPQNPQGRGGPQPNAGNTQPGSRTERNQR